MSKVNRNALRANYQNKGDVYDDEKTEAVFEAIADQVDTNDQELVDYKAKLASIMLGVSGARQIGSETIGGVTGNSVFEQIEDLKTQINQTALGQIPNGSIEPIKLSAAAKSAANITITDSSNHFTSADVEGALNELFTYANDGKTAIATVVGSPATIGDTFSQLQTKVQDSKNTLATNLSNKGQASTGTETLAALVDKVANVNTGKRFASGSATQTNGSAVLPFVTRTSPTATANTSFAYITVAGLSFKPSVIVAIDKTGPYQSTTVYNANSNYYGVAACDISSGVFTGTASDIRFIDITGNANVTNTGFTLPINNSSNSQTIDWVAYE